MQTLERDFAGPEQGLEPEPPKPRRRGPRATNLGTLLQWTVGVLLLGSAAIHFGAMGEHVGVSWTHGLFFASVAWAQIALAAVIVLRPSRWAAAAVIVVNLAILAVWLLTRTVGIAIGGDGTPEPWGWTDGLCAALEVLAILGSAAMLSRRLPRRLASATVGFGAVAVIALFVAAASGLVFSPAVSGGAAGHTHGAGGEAGAAGAAGHTHGGAVAVDDKGLSLLSNGHHSHFRPEVPLDTATRQVLTGQIAATIETARRYPTVADAEAAGYVRAGPYSPGLGAHWVLMNGKGLNFDGKMDPDDLATPLAIIYDGVQQNSRIAGFMYYAYSKTKPEGFAGPNDNWHYHKTVCLTRGADGGINAPFGSDREIPAKLCQSAGGSILKQTQWMVHVWSVPGWESAQGLFGEVNPALACPDGTYYQRPVKQWIEHPLNSCKSAT